MKSLRKRAIEKANQKLNMHEYIKGEKAKVDGYITTVRFRNTFWSEVQMTPLKIEN